MAVKHNEVGNIISVEEVPGLDPSDIPEFLKDEEDMHFDEDEHDTQRDF